VHGQFSQAGLLDTRQHRLLLDAFGGLGPQLAAVRAAWQAWQDAVQRLETLAREIEAARREEDYLRHRERELADLDAKPGEEEELAQSRQSLMHKDKLATALRETVEALSGNGGALERVGAAERRLERNAGLAPELLEPAVQALNRALAELGEAEATVDAALRQVLQGAGSLESIEERLFALRDAARKHRVPVDGLPALLAETQAQLQRIDAGASDAEATGREAEQRRRAYLAAAAELSRGRATAAEALAKALAQELPPLKLERASFRVRLEPLGEEAGALGQERVVFEVSTNPGQPFGPLSKIASGGELARFMLALKVVLAKLGSAGTLIFDEVDAGLGGATADAVGERLARLGADRQVLVVTHAPQVAARADHHLTVSKHVTGNHTQVRVSELAARQRRDEIARMLAGAEITDAARAAADSLMQAGGLR
jgi:DNA repair protein RecN (Recombination protein N)